MLCVKTSSFFCLVLFLCWTQDSVAVTPLDMQLQAARLPCASPYDGRDRGWRELAWETMKRTSIEASLELNEVNPASSDIFKYPLLIWSCPARVASLGQQAIANLRNHLKLGGLLFVDDPSATLQGPFEKSVRNILNRLFPGSSMGPIPWSHVLFKSFFLIDNVAGRVETRSRLLGLAKDGRLLVVYSSNDLLGAISKDLYGGWDFGIESGSDMREMSFEMGINLLMYALCLDYKDDRVHLPFIMKRRRL